MLIDVLDDDGYLTQPLEEIAALFSAEAEVDVEELAIALRHLQNLEPAGVGARSPSECLLLQLRALQDHPRLRARHRDRRQAPAAARQPRLRAPAQPHRRAGARSCARRRS